MNAPHWHHWLGFLTCRTHNCGHTPTRKNKCADIRPCRERGRRGQRRRSSLPSPTRRKRRSALTRTSQTACCTSKLFVNCYSASMAQTQLTRGNVTAMRRSTLMQTRNRADAGVPNAQSQLCGFIMQSHGVTRSSAVFRWNSFNGSYNAPQ